MADYIINTRGLIKTYGKNKAINDLTINVSSNQIIGLIGRNGSGKTTLMKLLAGLLEKTAGDLLVFSDTPVDNLHVAEGLVYTYHNVEYPRSFSLKDIIYGFKQMYSQFDEEFALKLVKYFDLSPKQKYRQLSQGMTSVFNFICGISTRAPLTMLDEPVLGMDVIVRKAVYEVLLRDFNEFPRTIIISSHLLSELEGILSEIILIDQGKLILHENIDDLREMAYRADGNWDSLEAFSRNKNIIYSKKGEMDSYNIISGALTVEEINQAREGNINLSKVRPEDLCLYLTQVNKEDELKCLWKK